MQVTRESVTQFTIRNGIFDTFDDAKKCCNLLAQQEERPHLTNGNPQEKTKRVKCSGCSKNFMSFSCKENKPVRLYNHEFLEKYLNHPCYIDSAPVGGIDGFNRNTVAEGRSYSYIYIDK